MKSTPEKRTTPVRKTVKAAVPKNGSTPKNRAVAEIATVPTKNPSGTQWTFLTNHAHVLILLAKNTSAVLRDVAIQVGITERAVQRIIAELEAGGVIEREKIGRQNHYRIRPEQPLRHQIESHRTIGELLELINGAKDPPSPRDV